MKGRPRNTMKPNPTGLYMNRTLRRFCPAHAAALLAVAPFLIGLNLSAQTPTVGGGTLASPAVGPAPAYNYEYGSLINGAVLVKNWDFGSAAGSTVHNIGEMSGEFYYHDQFGQIANNGSYGAKTVSPDVANRINSSQPVEGVNTATPVREFLSSSLKTYLVPLNGATTMDSALQNVGNGSFMAKWAAPNGGSLLGMDIIWETRVRYVTPPYFWFAIWASGNKWGSPSGAEMDIIESFGYNNGGVYTNYDGHAWHTDVVGNDTSLPTPRSQEESDYVNGSWGNLMANNGVTAFDATQWHTWTWVYKADNSFTVYLDGNPVQRGQTWWTFGAYTPDATHVPINMSFLFDASWSNNQVNGLKGFTLPASGLVGKYYEWDYSRVYYRQTTPNDMKNLALTATVTGYSSQEAANPVSHAINNTYNTNADRWSPVSAGYPNYFELDLGGNKQVVGTELVDVVGDSFKYKIEAKPDGGTYSTVVDKTAGTSTSPIQADNFAATTARFVKLTITGSSNGTTWIGVREFKVLGSDAVVPPSSNLALNKPVVVSNVQSGSSYVAANAVDGNSTTRWSTDALDNQWIYVDLGSVRSIGRVKLNWESSYASAYKIQTSTNASTWTDIYSTTTGNGAVDDLTGLMGSGRYVRVLGVTRATAFGISLYDFEVYGSTILSVANSGFESGDLTGWTTVASGGYGSGNGVTNNVLNQSAQYPTFSNPLPGTAAGTFYASVKGYDGNSAQVLYQDISANGLGNLQLEPGTTYTLTVAIGEGAYDWAANDGTIALINGNNPATWTILQSASVSTLGFTSYANNFKDLTVTFTTGSTVSGDLTIGVFTTHGYPSSGSVKLDNVRLTKMP